MESSNFFMHQRTISPILRLTLLQDSFPGAQLRRFLVSVRNCLAAAATPGASSMTCTHLLFQPSHLREHCSSLLLFGLGRLLSCEAGSSLLHAMEIPDLLLTLIVGGSGNKQDLSALKFPNVLKNLRKQRLLCAKFLLPSMSYTGSGFGRSLLATICSSGHTALRLFTAKFIRLLLRLNIPSAASWLVSLLLNLSCDRNSKVFHEAVSILEACRNIIPFSFFIRSNSPVRPLGIMSQSGVPPSSARMHADRR